jgi:hypothetical protein
VVQFYYQSRSYVGSRRSCNSNLVKANNQQPKTNAHRFLVPLGNGRANILASIVKPPSLPSRFPHHLHPIAASVLISHRLRLIGVSALTLHCRFRLDSPIACASLAPSPHGRYGHAALASRSSFACASWHRHRIPESVDELTSPYNRRNHPIPGRPSSIEVTFPIGRSLSFE